MARERLRLRYGNEIAGVFVLVGIGLLVWGITQIGESAEGWAKGAGKLRFDLDLPPSGAYGLKVGSQVRVLGAVAGSVTNIGMDAEGNMTARIAVSDKFRPIVTGTSEVRLKKEFGVAGDTYLEVSRGEGEPLPSGARLVVRSESRRELEGFIEGLVAEIRDEAIPALRDVRVAAQEYAKLARALRDPESQLQQLLGNMRDLTDALKEGRGTVGRLIKDPDVADRLTGVVERTDRAILRAEQFFEELRQGAAELKGASRNIRVETEELPELVQKVHKVLDETRGVLVEVRAASARLPDIADKAERGVETLPALMLQTQATLREMERLVEALQRHWLVSKYVEKSPPGRIAAEEAGGKR